MARPRAFDEETVLAGAMLAFRQYGFAGISVRHLEQATGISVGSLYNAYGHKNGLYRAAFAHYFRTIIEPRLGSAATLDDLERLFLGLLKPPMADGHGCLITNAVLESGTEDAVAADFVECGLDRLQATIESVLRREIGAKAAAAATLRLVLFYQGILVLARARRPARPIGPVIKAEFEQLRSMRRRRSTAK